MAFHDDKFLARFEKLEPKFTKGVYRIGRAKYAKNKCGLYFISDRSGFKTTANLLLDQIAANENSFGANRFYSSREKAYIIPISLTERFVEAYHQTYTQCSLI